MTLEIPELRDRVSLVTGASSGIGRATAHRLHRAGAKVVVCARRLERLEALGEELGATDDDFLAIATDLRDPGSIEALFGQLRERFGGTDVVVNSAGLGREAPLMTGATEDWREILEVNVLALATVTREAVADMRRRGDRGHVVHVSSMSGHRVPAGSAMYSASKFAVRSMTEGLRAELREAGSEIRVTAVSPGFVETEFAEVMHGSAEAAKEVYGRFPTLQPEDIAEAILYVLRQPDHVQFHDLLLRPTLQKS